MREINLEFFAKIIFGTCHMRLNPVHQMNFGSFCSSEVKFFLYFIGYPSCEFDLRVLSLEYLAREPFLTRKAYLGELIFNSNMSPVKERYSK